jgi:2-oxoglutarate ferredoxin oxidoreductase subunit beta
MMQRAAKHKGTAFIEVFQNCNIFNDGAFEIYTEKDTKADNVITLEHGKPMIFGKDRNKGIVLDGFKPKVVTLGDGYSESDLWIHDEFDDDPVRALIIARFNELPEFPAPIGILRQEFKSTYDEDFHLQINNIRKNKGEGDLRKLLFSGNLWEVK